MEDFSRLAWDRYAAWQAGYLALETEVSEVIAEGPFRALFSQASDVGEQEASVLVEPGLAHHLVEHARAIVSAVRARGRRPAFEFAEGAVPGLGERLEQFGFTLDERNPLMGVTPAGFHHERAAEVEVRLLTAGSEEETLAAFQAIRWTEGELGPAAVPDSDRLRAQIAEPGSLHVLAILDGPAGTGVLHQVQGIGEIAGIVTRSDRRRRGVALSITSFLVAQHFSRGGDFALLDAANDDAARVYARLGFREFGKLLVYR